MSANPRIRVLQDARATELVIAGGACTGARYVGRRGAEHRWTRGRSSPARHACSRPAARGRSFAKRPIPPVATGDGIALAAVQAGARVADLEFVQFHPTVMSVKGAPRFLLSEALRGEGAHLVNDAGERFMTRYEPAGDLASRDLVSRAIVREMERTGAPVYLSMAHLDP